jgi:hypothetical protein
MSASSLSPAMTPGPRVACCTRSRTRPRRTSYAAALTPAARRCDQDLRSFATKTRLPSCRFGMVSCRIRDEAPPGRSRPGIWTCSEDLWARRFAEQFDWRTAVGGRAAGRLRAPRLVACALPVSILRCDVSGELDFRPTSMLLSGHGGPTQDGAASDGPRIKPLLKPFGGQWPAEVVALGDRAVQRAEKL